MRSHPFCAQVDDRAPLSLCTLDLHSAQIYAIYEMISRTFAIDTEYIHFGVSALQDLQRRTDPVWRGNNHWENSLTAGWRCLLQLR